MYYPDIDAADLEPANPIPNECPCGSTNLESEETFEDYCPNPMTNPHSTRACGHIVWCLDCGKECEVNLDGEIVSDWEEPEDAD